MQGDDQRVEGVMRGSLFLRCCLLCGGATSVPRAHGQRPPGCGAAPGSGSGGALASRGEPVARTGVSERFGAFYVCRLRVGGGSFRGGSGFDWYRACGGKDEPTHVVLTPIPILTYPSIPLLAGSVVGRLSLI